MELLRRFFFFSFYDIECLIVVEKSKPLCRITLKPDSDYMYMYCHLLQIEDCLLAITISFFRDKQIAVWFLKF